jgi:hypothetical protein
LNKIQNPEQERKYLAAIEETTDTSGWEIPNVVTGVLKHDQTQSQK